MEEAKVPNNLSPKLVADVNAKTKYVLHFGLLLFVLSCGYLITDVMKNISFKQTAWMKPYVDFNTFQRSIATNLFMIDFFKLLVNCLW